MANNQKSAKSINAGLKPETIAKMVKALNERIAYYCEKIEKGENVKICISKGNRKIGFVPNVSLAPIVTCGKMCKYCKSLCYDGKACLQYKNVLDARARNTALMLSNMQEYFRQVHEFLAHTKKTVFRFHVGGEIPNAIYFDYVLDIVKDFPHINFWLYTKQYGIVNSILSQTEKPENLQIMISVWKTINGKGEIVIVPYENPHNLPTFTVRFNGEKTPNAYQCKGNCQYCIDNHRGCIAGESAYANAH